MFRQKLTYHSFLLFCFLYNFPFRAYAQNNQGAVKALQDATKELNSYFDPATKVMYAISAIVGLIGGIKVYSKWNSGDPDTQKVAASWFGACIFLVVVATVIKTFFGIGSEITSK